MTPLDLEIRVQCRLSQIRHRVLLNRMINFVLSGILDISFAICYNASRQKRCECPWRHAKIPGVATSGDFLFRFGWVA